MSGGRLPLGRKVGGRSKGWKKVRFSSWMLLVVGIGVSASLVVVMLVATASTETSTPQLAEEGAARSLSVATGSGADDKDKEKKTKTKPTTTTKKKNFKKEGEESSKVIVLPPAKPADDLSSGGSRADPAKKRAGFMVLGMHRSGTSMLAGIMVQGMGYHVGSPLIGAGPGNAKGHFELLPVVLQNDQFMNKQKVWWGANIMQYDVAKAAEMQKSGAVSFSQGVKALQFLNDDKTSIPWLQKDPRMCLTLHTWLPLLHSEPAIVFTYRHPLQVAQSLLKRNGKQLVQGLRLWTGYNIRALQNSEGMCRVFSSNDAILANPREEVQRIADQLTHKCHVPPPPRPILAQATVDEFVDVQLQHNKAPAQQPAIVETTPDGCEIPDYTSDKPKGSTPWQRERKFYLMAMRLHCDLQSGKAYQPNYPFPKPF